jgi:putative sterol carrier protein
MLRTAARKASGIVVEVETALGVTVEVVAPRLEQPPTQRPINDPYPAEIETGKIIEADEPISPEERPVEVEHPPRVEGTDAPDAPHRARETVGEGVFQTPDANVNTSDEAAHPAHSPNGASAAVYQAAQKPAKHKPFTESWAAAYHEALNTNTAYYAASTRWDAGAVALVTLPEMRQNITNITAVLLDLNHGKCRSAGLVTLSEAMQKAAFVIEGDYATWMEVLAGNLSPLGAITRGKLRLKKGALTRLLPFTKSAAELVKTAQLI